MTEVYRHDPSGAGNEGRCGPTATAMVSCGSPRRRDRTAGGSHPWVGRGPKAITTGSFRSSAPISASAATVRYASYNYTLAGPAPHSIAWRINCSGPCHPLSARAIAAPPNTYRSATTPRRVSRSPRRRKASSMPALSSSGEGSLTLRRSRSRRRTPRACARRPARAREPVCAPGASNGNQKRLRPRKADHWGRPPHPASRDARQARPGASECRNQARPRRRPRARRWSSDW